MVQCQPRVSKYQTRFAMSIALAVGASLGAATSAMARPALCDAAVTRAAVSEQFYTNTLITMRGELSKRFADPFEGNGSQFSAGITAARPRLQAAVTMNRIVDGGYFAQINARSCSAMLVVKGVESLPVGTRYAVRETTTGQPVVEAEYTLPGDGSWTTQFNVAHALFKGLYVVAFLDAQTVAQTAMNKAYGDLLSRLNEAERNAMDEDQSAWAAGLKAKCSAGKPDCVVEPTIARTATLVRAMELRDATVKMDKAYAAALQHLDQDGQAGLKEQQRLWKVEREKCSDGDLLRCMTEMTVKRTIELQAQR